MKLSSFVTDTSLEQEGVWVDIGDGAEIRVARAGNPEHEALLRKLRKPHEKRFRSGEIPPDLAKSIAVEAMARHILLDWRGITEDDGTPIPYSYENAKRLLGLRDFREMVAEIAMEAETFRAQEIREAGAELSTFPPVAPGVGTAAGEAPASH